MTDKTKEWESFTHEKTKEKWLLEPCKEFMSDRIKSREAVESRMQKIWDRRHVAPGAEGDILYLLNAFSYLMWMMDYFDLWSKIESRYGSKT